MRLVVNTRHEPSERQAQMLADYIKKDNKESLAYDEDVNLVYSLTHKGVQAIKCNSNGQ